MARDMKLTMVVLLAATISLVGCGKSEWQQGYEAGVAHVREWRKDNPNEPTAIKAVAKASRAIATPFIKGFELYADDPTKSAEWNAGCRQGQKNELDK